MPLDLWTAFVLASLAITLLPGPSMLLVIADAASHGARPALVTAAGVVLADAILLILALAGIGAILAASAAAFTALKWAGALVLIWMGWRQWRAGGGAARPAAPTARPAWHRFARGLVVTLLNPKIVAFFLAFFPQFVSPGAPAWPQLLILGPTFLAVVAAVLAAYAAAAGSVRSALSTPRAARVLARISGATLIGAGVLTAAMRRQG